MSTPPSREHSLRLPSPGLERPAFTRSTSSARSSVTAIAPKSEYLRNALQARRAQNNTTPPPRDARPPPPAAAAPLALLTPSTSPDIFDQFALTEEQTTPVSPIRRSRPGEAGLPTSKTNRELTTEIERLKDNLMTSKMRVELLKKNNHELQVDLTKAKEIAEQVEPLEEENIMLSNENNIMRQKLERYEDEVLQLRDTNQDLREANEALAETNNESVLQFETQDDAFNEAIEIIANLEDEKEALKQELQKIKDRVAAIEAGNNPPLHVDGGSSYPARICSIDDSCPSTAHFDSDYYSQPASPRVDSDKISIRSNRSMSTSVRSKRFRELSLQQRQSAQDLTKRMSQASLRAASLRSSVLSQDVPHRPRQHKQANPDRAGYVANVARHRCLDHLYVEKPQQPHYVDAPQQLPPRSATVTPHVKSSRPSGLRAMYNPNEVVVRRQSNCRCSSSSNDVSPSNSSRTHSCQSSVFDHSPPAPPRTSSRHAYTGSFEEHANQDSQQSIDTDVSPTSEAPAEPEYLSSEWAAPARDSLVSDLTHVAPDPRDKDRWWKSVDRLTQTEAKEKQGAESGDAGHLRSFRARNRLSRANSSPHAGTQAGLEEEDQFLKRMKARVFKRRDSTKESTKVTS